MTDSTPTMCVKEMMHSTRTMCVKEMMHSTRTMCVMPARARYKQPQSQTFQLSYTNRWAKDVLITRHKSIPDSNQMTKATTTKTKPLDRKNSPNFQKIMVSYFFYFFLFFFASWFQDDYIHLWGGQIFWSSAAGTRLAPPARPTLTTRERHDHSLGMFLRTDACCRRGQGWWWGPHQGSCLPTESPAGKSGNWFRPRTESEEGVVELDLQTENCNCRLGLKSFHGKFFYIFFKMKPLTYWTCIHYSTGNT